MSIEKIKVDDEEFQLGLQIEKDHTPRWKIVSETTYVQKVLKNLARNARFYTNVVKLREREREV